MLNSPLKYELWCPPPQVPSLPSDFFDSGALADAGGLVDNLPKEVRREAYYAHMRDALVSVNLATRS